MLKNWLTENFNFAGKFRIVEATKLQLPMILSCSMKLLITVDLHILRCTQFMLRRNLPAANPAQNFIERDMYVQYSNVRRIGG